MGVVVDFLELKERTKVTDSNLVSVVDNRLKGEDVVDEGGYVDGEWYSTEEIEWIKGMQEMEQFHNEVTSKEVWSFEEGILKVKYQD